MALDLWIDREVSRIQSLTDQDLITEVYNVMNSYNYSWTTLDQRFREGVSNINTILNREWNELCDIKRAWEAFPSLAHTPYNLLLMFTPMSQNNI